MNIESQRLEGIHDVVRQEGFILDVTERICELMNQQGISRETLAQRMGKSKSQISRLLDGVRDMTLRELSDIADGIGVDVKVEMRGPK